MRQRVQGDWTEVDLKKDKECLHMLCLEYAFPTGQPFTELGRGFLQLYGEAEKKDFKKAQACQKGGRRCHWTAHNLQLAHMAEENKDPRPIQPRNRNR